MCRKTCLCPGVQSALIFFKLSCKNIEFTFSECVHCCCNVSQNVSTPGPIRSYILPPNSSYPLFVGKYFLFLCQIVLCVLICHKMCLCLWVQSGHISFLQIAHILASSVWNQTLHNQWWTGGTVWTTYKNLEYCSWSIQRYTRERLEKEIN